VKLIRNACLATALIVGLFAALPLRADAANFAGRWYLHGSIGILPANGTCTFRQSGTTLRGSCLSLGSRAVATGAVDGSHVFWRVRNTSSRGAFDGRLVGPGVIRGTWTTTLAPGIGSFTATRS
jgi:hypothetical protein